MVCSVNMIMGKFHAKSSCESDIKVLVCWCEGRLEAAGGLLLLITETYKLFREKKSETFNIFFSVPMGTLIEVYPEINSPVSNSPESFCRLRSDILRLLTPATLSCSSIMEWGQQQHPSVRQVIDFVQSFSFPLPTFLTSDFYSSGLTEPQLISRTGGGSLSKFIHTS